jgi:hypothetical protein
MEIRQRTATTVLDAGKYSLSDIKINARNLVFTETNGSYSGMFTMPETSMVLTVDEVKHLIEQLQIALKLHGKDFIVHETQGVTVGDLDEHNSELYDSYQDYLDGTVSE